MNSVIRIVTKIQWLVCIILILTISCEKEPNAPEVQDVTITSLTSDFKIAPNTVFSEGMNFRNVSIASDENNGFLVVWTNEYHSGASFILQNYACRISKTGEILDKEAIPVCKSNWPYYIPSAVFAGGNWIICSQEGSLTEWVQVMRLSPTGQILDATPVNICSSIGEATVLYPTIATNGHEILCVTGIAGDGIFGSIFNSNLQILVQRFLVYSPISAHHFVRVTANGNNFMVTLKDGTNIRLITINPEGQILKSQDVCDYPDYPEYSFYCGSFIKTINNITYVIYFREIIGSGETPAFWVRRYSSNGESLDSNPIKLNESQDFLDFLEKYYSSSHTEAYFDFENINKHFIFFLPNVSSPGISANMFESDLSAWYKLISISNQCQLCIKQTWPDPKWNHNSWSFIRAASIGNVVLTAWIDDREATGNGRVYGNLVEIK